MLKRLTASHPEKETRVRRPLEEYLFQTVPLPPVEQSLGQLNPFLNKNEQDPQNFSSTSFGELVTGQEIDEAGCTRVILPSQEIEFLMGKQIQRIYKNPRAGEVTISYNTAQGLVRRVVISGEDISRISCF